MHDFVVAVGLVFVIEGLVFAAIPGLTKRALAAVQETPEPVLRAVGLIGAVLGLVVIWLIRG